MPALESHTGLLRQATPHWNRRSFIDISPSHSYYTIMPALQANMRRAINSKWTKFNFGLPKQVTSDGGYQFHYNVQVTSDNNGEWVGPDDPLSINKQDHQVQLTYPWRLARMGVWSYDDWEISACKGAEEIVNLTTSRMLANEVGSAEFMENWGWGAPPASTDTKTAFPFRYFLYTEPESTTGSYSAFTGINSGTLNGNLLNVNHGSYTSGPGGQSRATWRRLGNWNSQYTTFADSDCIEKLQHAVLDTQFFSPANYPNAVKDAPERAMYTTKGNQIIAARLRRQQNDQNGNDLVARWSDLDVFQIPMYRVPYFEDTASFVLYGSGQKDPIYGIDWSTWYWASKSGFTMQDKIFGPEMNAPLTWTHARWLGGQLCCLDPSRNFVLSK